MGRAVGASLTAALFLSCAGRPEPSPRIHLDTDRQPAAIEVVGLPSAALAQLSAKALRSEDWNALMRVSVGIAGAAPAGDAQMPAVAGDYAVDGGVLRFTPLFPLDAGRQYTVRFDPSRLPGSASDGAWRERLVTATVSTPAADRVPSTIVAGVYPSADVLPANQLRLYIHFSTPMGLRSGFEHIRLLDDRGEDVVDPFLPIDSDYWNEDRTRYTLFFDPGRVKRGILPNRQMGRALEPGRRYTLVIGSAWEDGQGLPLQREFRREFGVRAPDERGLSLDAWTIDPPPAGTRTALAVRFPAPLDRGLLQRALGISRGGEALAGKISLEESETRWLFVPREPWQAGDHQLVVLSILEDLAGNRIGQPFEVDEFERTDRHAEPERFTVPFRVRPPTIP